MAKQFKNDFIRQGAASLRLALADFKSAYSGSVFGALWAVAEPLVTVLVYWFVYTIAFGGQTVCGVPFYLWLSVGIAPWFFISNGLGGVVMCYRDYSYLVKKTRFKKAALPFVRTASAFISHLIFLALVLIVRAVSGFESVSLLYLLLSVAVSSVFVYALGRILALLCAAFKDIKNITAVALNIGFWLTPIFWSAGSAPERLTGLIFLNPAAVIAEMYRTAVLGNSFIDGRHIAYMLIVCAVLLVVGSLYEKRAVLNIADKL